MDPTTLDQRCREMRERRERAARLALERKAAKARAQAEARIAAAAELERQRAALAAAREARRQAAEAERLERIAAAQRRRREAERAAATVPTPEMFRPRRPVIRVAYVGDWTRAEMHALAAPSCTACEGTGARESGKPCACVLRTVFRACLRTFRHIEQRPAHLSQVSLSHVRPGAPRRSNIYSRKSEEFAADFVRIARRALTPADYAVFWLHYVQGWSWRRCCERTRMDRGAFFHAAYRIEARCGRAYRELRPHGLYPIAQYFAPTAAHRTPLKAMAA